MSKLPQPKGATISQPFTTKQSKKPKYCNKDKPILVIVLKLGDKSALFGEKI